MKKIPEVLLKREKEKSCFPSQKKTDNPELKVAIFYNKSYFIKMFQTC